MEDYNPGQYKAAARLAARQQPDIDASLYDPDWYRHQDERLVRDVRRWLDAEVKQRVALPWMFLERDRDLMRHMDAALPHPAGVEIGGPLVRAVSAGLMREHLRAHRARQ